MTDSARSTVLQSLMGITQDHVRTGTLLNLSLFIPGIGEVHCREVFRSIRGKRLVCLGNLQGANVIMKLYFARHRAHRHWRRSDNGCRAFLERGIPAPGILFSGYLPEYDFYAMVLEFLEGATRIDRMLETMNEEQERPGLLERLMRELARHHMAHILQNDLHLGNFMVKGHDIYSLDGDQVKICRILPGRKRSLKNLVGLLANLPSSRDADLDACIQCYGEERNWILTEAEVSDVKNAVYGIRKKCLSRYLGKSLKSRDPFVARTKPGMFMVIDKRHTDIHLEDILGAAGKPVKAQGDLGRMGFRVINCGGNDLLELSLFAVGPQIFKRVFGAVRVWSNALMLNRIGLQTPEPVALVLRRKAPFLWRCSVFFRAVEGIGLRSYISSSVSAQDAGDRISSGLMDAFDRMGRVGISPGRLLPEQVMISGKRLLFMNPGAFRRPVVFFGNRYALALNRFFTRYGHMVAPGEDTSRPG